MRPVDWIYLLLAATFMLAAVGAALFQMSFRSVHPYGAKRAQLAYLWTIVAMVPLGIAGVIMWDALGWPP